MDKILEKLNLKYEDLNFSERETLNLWLETLNKGQITLEDVKAHITSMKDSVETELANTSHNTKQDLFLKARLRNYILLEGFLSSPERAKRAIEQQLSGIGKNI